MNDLNEMNLDALRVELAYRRALLAPTDRIRFRARLPHRLLRRRPPRDTFSES